VDKKPLIGVSICAVVLLVLGSLSNVVGYQSVKSTTVNDSPLFQTRTQRATNQQQNSITSQYLGMGINALSFPLRDTNTKMIQKFIDRIRTMDDDTFNRFIDYVVNQINHKNNLKSVDVNDFIKGLRQIRKNTQNIVVDKDLDDNKITYSNDYNPTKCGLPGFIIGYFLIGIIIMIIMVFLLLISQPSLAAPPCLLQFQ
jgi:hypothetical protein